MTTLICDCNKTMSLDARALRQALGDERSAGLETVHSTLCRRQAPAFQQAACTGDDLLIACTQEQRLFLELNERTEGAAGLDERPIRFVNIRETGGWSKDGADAMPKIAALIAVAQLPDPEPVATVDYHSAGRVLVIGAPEPAARAAQLLGDGLDVSLLIDGFGTLPQERTIPVHTGTVKSIDGWLGAFDVSWTSADPIDPDLCTRCNACIDVCPEGAIDFSYRIDFDRCRSHRACVTACGSAGAIDFNREPERFDERFDLILDLGTQPLIKLHQPPQGYFHAHGEAAMLEAVLQLRDCVGDFEKPRFFRYRQSICAHSRNEQIGCTACIDVCSAQAIRSDASRKGHAPAVTASMAPQQRATLTSQATNTGAGIIVEPHLCVGCGACTTVCPSGAISYATPGTDLFGKRIRTLLSTFHGAGGKEATLLIHSAKGGVDAINALGRLARTDATVHGIPANVLPLAAWHTASVGLDLWLAAFAYGATRVVVLMTDEEAPAYRTAIAEQMAIAQAILTGFGRAGEHLQIVDGRDPGELDRQLAALVRPVVPAPLARSTATTGTHTTATNTSVPAASFAVQADKRATLDFAIDHLRKTAPLQPDTIALPVAGTPFGNVLVDAGKCTLCLSCVGACPESALADNPARPELRFIEANCVQCGLCESTCPEQAIVLESRLLLADEGKARKQMRVLNAAEPFRCIRCAKPFGTVQAITLMTSRLASHSMFQGRAADRLKMCGDCRVIDLHRNPDETRIV